MKKAVVALTVCLFFPLVPYLQVFSSNTPANIPPWSDELLVPLEVSGLDIEMGSNFGLQEICLTINHPRCEDLTIKLISPDGTSSTLFYDIGGMGANVTNLCLSDIGQPVYNTSAPFNGNFRSMLPIGVHNNGQNPNGTWLLKIMDVVAGETGTFMNCSLHFGSNPALPFAVHESPLPIILLKTLEEPIGDYYKVKIGFQIIDQGLNHVTDTIYSFDGFALTEWQGWSSPNGPKKNYDLDLVDALGNKINAGLLNMPPENDWILKAEYSDKTSLKNTLVSELAQSFPGYSPRMRQCEVFLDGEYIGLYTLTEKVKRDENRVKIEALTPNEISGKELTGGYIIEMNTTGATPAWLSQYAPINDATTSYPVEFKCVYPKINDIHPSQLAYIHAYVDSFETALNGMDFQSESVGYRRFISVFSFIDFMLLNEFSGNYDSYGRSTYMFKEHDDNGGKLHIGPPWDYDRTFGLDFPSTTGWVWEITNYYWPFPFWWSKLWSDERFRRESACRWKSHRNEHFDYGNIIHRVDSLVLLIGEAKTRNDYVWPDAEGVDFNTRINQLKDFITQRIAWIDNQFISFSDSIPQMPNLVDIELCFGDTLIIPPPQDVHVNWSPGPDENIFIPIQTGAYTLTLSDSLGCYTRDTILITVNHPDAGFIVSPLEGNHFVACSPIELSADSYNWNFGNGESSINTMPQSLYTQNGVYEITLQIIDTNGCAAMEKQSIWVNTTDINTQLLVAYPNPMNGLTTLVADSNLWDQELNLMDNTGRFLKSFRIEDYNSPIDLREFGYGMYWLTNLTRSISLKIVYF